MEVLSLVVKNPIDILVSPTEAVLFRTAVGKTQLLDEVDTWGNEEHLRAVLNAGFKKTGAVARAEQTGEGPYRVRSHRVFCPRVLAGIGDRILNATTRDRTFMVRMERQTRSERRERFRSQKVSSEGKGIHDQIAAWVRAFPLLQLQAPGLLTEHNNLPVSREFDLGARPESEPVA